VIVTRPPAQAAHWVRALAEQGLNAQALPLIDIAPPPDADAVQQAWLQLPMQDFVMFVSANAVEQFFALRPPGAAWPGALRAGSTGQGTSAALRSCGVPPALVAQPAPGEPSESEALWQQIADQPWRGRRVLVVRGEGGRNWLAQQFEHAGAQVAFLVAYQRRRPVLDDAQATLLARALADPLHHVWLFSSSEAVDNLRALNPGADWFFSQALATHPRIAAVARAAGFAQVSVVEPQVQAVAAGCAHLESRAP